MASGFSLKDQLFNREKVRYLAGLFAAAEPGFDAEAFEAQVMAELPSLELKQRMTLIAEVLADHLPEALPAAAPVLLKALPPPLDPGRTDDDFGDFIFAPLGEYVAAKGVAAHPDLVMDRLQAWREAGAQDRKELDWMTSHALRGLVKAGHPRAMAMLGYDPELTLDALIAVPDQVRIGEALDFSCRLQGAAGAPVLVDYILHFQRPGGKASAKVFKLKQARITGGVLELGKKHKLKGDATTFKLVPGPHRIELMVNGKVRAGAEFELLPEG
ncbi:hypothetical protein [Leisingera thetidis]|uniref:hypothetical protein n=1 Tax=Leisingera thetidis TaxID=2930199 RepID=UPI0021F6A0A6|nr:hypothetical protein [Leisingera thetidis]